MPVYNVACRTRLTPELDAEVAASITRTHCELTGAPPEFVSAVLLYGYPLRRGVELSVIAAVRGGGNRDAALLDTLRDTLRTRIADTCAIATSAVRVELIATPASWVMEGGRILPEPGEELGWLAH